MSMLFQLTARWAEAEVGAYPYLAGEDPMRLLLPTVHGQRRGGTLLLGASSIGEAFLYEKLQSTWKSPVRSGSLSGATLDDCILFLSYVEQAYGAQALPNRILVGMSPRVLANIPRVFGSMADPNAPAYTIGAISRYSTKFDVLRQEFGTTLTPKSTAQSLLATASFYLTKQQPRYRTGVLAVIDHLLDSDPVKGDFQKGYPGYPAYPRDLLSAANLLTTIAWVKDAGLAEPLRKWLRMFRSAYNIQLMRPLDPQLLESRIRRHDMSRYEFDPRTNGQLAAVQLGRLAQFVNRHHLELIVVYLPEHPSFRARYDPGRYAAYRDTVEKHLPMAGFLDLRDDLSADYFFDEVHVSYAGALRATHRLMEFVEQTGGPSLEARQRRLWRH
jgi:hypothetical protein